MCKIAALILTKNEEIHIERCLKSISSLVNKIYVIDSGSTDKTKDICQKYGANFIVNPWINYSKQFNFGLNIVRKDKYDWILRIDADEVFTNKLIKDIKEFLNKKDPEISGIMLSRLVVFQNKILRFGGVKSQLLRIFRPNKGICEDRYMDEHIILDGKVKTLHEPYYEYPLRNLTWWIQKHNLYSNREVIDILNLRKEKVFEKSKLGLRPKIVRFLKTKLYGNFPLFIRAPLLFILKYFFLLGFLDGRRGLIYIFLQSFWYRFLVDCKVLELKQYARKNNLSKKEAVKEVLGIDLELDENY